MSHVTGGVGGVDSHPTRRLAESITPRRVRVFIDFTAAVLSSNFLSLPVVLFQAIQKSQNYLANYRKATKGKLHFFPPLVGNKNAPVIAPTPATNPGILSTSIWI